MPSKKTTGRAAADSTSSPATPPPTASKPVASKPVASKPVASKPAASKPMPKPRAPRRPREAATVTAPAGAAAATAAIAAVPSVATAGDGAAELAFLDGWREQQTGQITAGGSLVVRYEPTRFAPTPMKEIVGYARFLPGGQLRHATLRGDRRPAPAAEIPVPPETRHVELWFQCTDEAGDVVWDSSFGANYRFDVVRPRPTPSDSLRPRAGAVVDARIVSVDTDAAVKENTFSSRPGYSIAGARLQTSLHVAARVRREAAASSVWIDVHFFEADASLIHGDTLPLRAVDGDDDAHDLFVLDGTLYQGSVATPGSVTPRPDVRLVEYRVYCETGDRVVTDGLVHRCELATDALTS